MKAIRVHEHGGLDAMKLDELPQPKLAAGHVLVRVIAAGVNFIDTYHRTGLYKVPLPFTLGQEGAGVVESVAGDVTLVNKGDRVAWATGPGSYAEYVSLPADRLVKIPDSLSDTIAAAAMLQGMTAHYLATTTFPLQKGDICLVYAAAGGVGHLLTQIAKLRGATVIGTASTDEKAKLAREMGADYVIRYSSRDVATDVKEMTGGRGVDVVYDGVGKSTFMSSIDALRPRGMLVSFGNASGPVESFSPLLLGQKGSLFLTRPILAHYIAQREELEARASDVFKWIEDGSLRIRIDRELPLEQAAEAHRALEARETSGKVLLIS